MNSFISGLVLLLLVNPNLPQIWLHFQNQFHPVKVWIRTHSMAALDAVSVVKLQMWKDVSLKLHGKQSFLQTLWILSKNWPKILHTNTLFQDNLAKPVPERWNQSALHLTEAKDDGVLEWQWHQLDYMQTRICTSLQTDNHTNTSSLNFYRPDALPDTQPTASKHWRQCITRGYLTTYTVSY